MPIKEVSVKEIEQNPSNFKVCKKCGALNWNENKECFNCDFKEFDTSTEAVLSWVENTIDFWIALEGYTEEEAKNVYAYVN